MQNTYSATCQDRTNICPLPLDLGIQTAATPVERETCHYRFSYYFQDIAPKVKEIQEVDV